MLFVVAKFLIRRVMLTLRTLLLLLLNTLLLFLCYCFHNYYSFPNTNWFNLWTRNTW